MVSCLSSPWADYDCLLMGWSGRVRDTVYAFDGSKKSLSSSMAGFRVERLHILHQDEGGTVPRLSS